MESLPQKEKRHDEKPKLALTDREVVPKSSPKMVIMNRPVVAPKSLTTIVALGLSYEKLLDKKPAWPNAEADIVSARPNPTLTKHFELESET
jgi:hypothetical protein